DAKKKAAEDAAAKLKADADAKAKADAEAKKLAAMDAEAKAKAEAEAKKKAAEDAAAKLKADADAKAKADAEAKKLAAMDAEAKAKAEAEAKKKAAEDAAAKLKADADAKAKADAEAKKLAAMDAEAKAKAEAEAKKKAAEEAAAKLKADADAKAKADAEAKKLAAMDADAKAKAEAAAKKKAAEEAAAKLKADAENKKALEGDTKYKSVITRADNAFTKKDWPTAKLLYTEAVGMKPSEVYPKNKLKEVEDAMKVNVVKQNEIDNKTKNTVLPTLGGAEGKYKEAIKTADGLFALKRYRDAKKNYETALTYKGGDTYAKDKLIECEKLLNADAAQVVDDRVKQLISKYGPGITEETISGTGVVILQRVVVKDNMAWVYQKKMFNWGGVSYFRDSSPITESTFEGETKP
ncbi:MAG: hypothetical protein HYX39_09785, partial [Bacteroidetes bacterium]|nr:hypothetical protein [Bacteroidota bacterium]